MKKVIYFLIFLLSKSILFYSQTGSVDTTFYKSGDIRSITNNTGERYSSEIRYFKNSKNNLDKNKPIIDSVFNNDFANKKKWTYYDGSTRIFLHGKSNIWIGKITKYGSNRDSTYFKIKGVYHYLFKDLNDLQLTLSYNNDTTIVFLSIEINDSSKKGNFHKEQFVVNRYNPKFGVKFSEGEGNSIFKCGNEGVLELFFNNNLLSKAVFYPKNKKMNTTVYEFYDNFFCKKYYHLFNQMECGNFFEYHENGNLKCIGYYKTFKIGSKCICKKEGLWQYFKTNGETLKVESWKDGTMVN